MRRVLYIRQDNNGDVILQGPAIRAVRAVADHVTLLCGPRGVAAAKLLPGVDDIIVAEAAWIDAQPQAVQREGIDALIDRIAGGRFDTAIISTSFHQSPLPAALLARMAGVPQVGAISVDYPGSLLDVRHRVEDDIHEVQRALSLVEAMGFPSRGQQLELTGLPERAPIDAHGAIVVHPGATVPARAWSAQANTALVELLARRGERVIVTGGNDEVALTHRVASASPDAIDAGGRTTFAQFAAIVRDAGVVVSGNTAAAHVAAAVGTPVVSIFAPTIPAVRFRPWNVEHVLLGDQEISCRGCRARECAIPGQPCTSVVTPADVVAAIYSLPRAHRTLRQPL